MSHKLQSISRLFDPHQISEYIDEIVAVDTYHDRRLLLIETTRSAQIAERWDDMVDAAKQLIELDSQQNKEAKDIFALTKDELLLVSVAFKEAISSRRTTWRTLSCDEARGNVLVNEYCLQIESEIEALANEFIRLLTEFLIPTQRQAIDEALDINIVHMVNTQNVPRSLHPDFGHVHPGQVSVELLIQSIQLHKQTLISYLKLCGDYYRYLAEIQPRESGVANKAVGYYEEAYVLARSPIRSPKHDKETEKKDDKDNLNNLSDKDDDELPFEDEEETLLVAGSVNDQHDTLDRTHPSRLALVLNYSVCCYELMEERHKAFEIAQEAFDGAFSHLRALEDFQYKDTSLLLSLLRDNLSLWGALDDEHLKDWIP